jgi:predicted TPR repeat methyltransferase
MPSLDTGSGYKQFLSLVESTVVRYRSHGRFVQGFVRGKLLRDPVYREILKMSILPVMGKIVDLGCGRGILLALLTTARKLNMSDTSQLAFQGIELSEMNAEIARNTLGSDADIVDGDICSQVLPNCRAVILIDVLMYLHKEEQEALLQKVANALEPEGLLIIREADATKSLAFFITWLSERCCAMARGHWRQHNFYRSQKDWISLLAQLGFSVVTFPMSQGTPFANFLFVGRLRTTEGVQIETFVNS